MKYAVKFTASSERRFFKALKSISVEAIKKRIEESVISLENKPFPFLDRSGSYFKRLNLVIEYYDLTAKYRIRVGDYRILYDVDTETKTVWILD
jgi:mRNA-degrading endonuclease RelE of RelBE toxin-antitoxin system